MPDGVSSSWQEDVVVATRAHILKTDSQAGDGFAYLFSSDTPNKWEMLGPVLKNRKVIIQGGASIDTFAVYREYGTAAFVNPGQSYQPSVQNVLVKGTVPWRHMRFHWSVLDEELMANRSEEKLIGVIRPRQAAAKLDAAKLIEAEWFADPVYGSSVQPLTASYWTVPIFARQVYDYDTSGAATALTYGVNKWGAFQGGLPNNGQSGNAFVDVGGIDPGGAYTSASGFASSTYGRHRNWNFVWSNASGNFTDVDAKNLGHAMDALDFDPPFMVDEIQKTPYALQRLCSCQTVKDSMEQFAREGNDSVGVDVARFQNATLFRGLPVRHIKAMDTYTAYRGYYPIQGYNWAHGHVAVRSGEFFREQTFGPDKTQPDMTTTYSYLSYQPLVTDRQKFSFIGSYVAGSAS